MPTSPEEHWVELGGNLARALSALDDTLADPDLPEEQRKKFEAARANAAAALVEYRKLSPAEVGLHFAAQHLRGIVSVRCAGCGTALEESGAAPAGARPPCPRCGSTHRVRELTLG